MNDLWLGVAIGYIDNIEFDIRIGAYSSESEALSALESARNLKITVSNGIPAISMFVRGRPSYFFDGSVHISEISEEKRLSMITSFGVAESSDKKVGHDFLKPRKVSDYAVQDSDMIPTGKSLSFYIEKFGLDSDLELIGYKIKKMKIVETSVEADPVWDREAKNLILGIKIFLEECGQSVTGIAVVDELDKGRAYLIDKIYDYEQHKTPFSETCLNLLDCYINGQKNTAVAVASIAKRMLQQTN